MISKHEREAANPKLDKTALTYASVMGLMKDTNINGAQYSWVASIYCQ